MRKTRRIRAVGTLFILLLAGALFAACRQAGELQTVTETVGLADADDAVVELRMGAGRLTVSADAAALMDGR